MTGTFSNPSKGQSGPRSGRSGRSPVLQRAGREPRAAGDAESSLSDDDLGDGLVLRDGRVHLAAARHPGELKLSTKQSADQKISALTDHLNTLLRALADAKILGR